MFPQLRFSKSKKFVSRSDFGELQLTQILLNFKTSCCNLKIWGLGAKLCVAFLLFLLSFPYTFLERPTLFFSSYKNHILKVKLGWVGAHQREKKAFLVPLILSERILFNIYVLSKCIVYWIHFQKIHTLKDNKTLIHALFYLFLK